MWRIMQAIDRLREKGSTVEIYWVLANIYLRGNEVVDKAVKKATGWRIKKLRRGGLRDEDTPSTAAKTQWAKELLSARLS